MRRPMILVVEDDPNDRFLVQNAFLHIGVSEPIHTVHNGSEALDYVKGAGCYADRAQFKFPTLILLDLKMPEINGFEFLDYIKKNPHLAVIPTIVFTSSSEVEDVKRAYLLGANSYIVKAGTFDGICSQLKFIYGYWMRVEVPPVERQGNLPEALSPAALIEQIQRH